MIAEVADGVFVAWSAIDSTTSTIVVSGSDVLLVDPAWTIDELDTLAGEIERRGWRVTAGFSTHAHHDHLLWHPRFGDVPRWTSARAARAACEGRAGLLAAWRADSGEIPDRFADLFGSVRAAPGDMMPDLFGKRPDGAEPMELIVHDGHAPGHSGLWLPGRGVLIAGDMLSDVELPMPFDPDDLPAYERGLETLEPYVRRADLLIPGHGSPTHDPVARLEADSAYLEAVTAGRPSADPRTCLPGMREVDRRIRALAGAGDPGRLR